MPNIDELVLGTLEARASVTSDRGVLLAIGGIDASVTA